jgi:hypothetical protein
MHGRRGSLGKLVASREIRSLTRKKKVVIVIAPSLSPSGIGQCTNAGNLDGNSPQIPGIHGKEDEIKAGKRSRFILPSLFGPLGELLGVGKVLVRDLLGRVPIRKQVPGWTGIQGVRSPKIHIFSSATI